MSELIKTDLILRIPLSISYTPDRNENVLFWKAADATCTVTIDDKNVGRVSGLMGGGVELKKTEDRRTFHVSAEDIWKAFETALMEEKK